MKLAEVKTILVGGFNPFEKILVKLDHFPNFRNENEKYLKPPARIWFWTYIFPDSVSCFFPTKKRPQEVNNQRRLDGGWFSKEPRLLVCQQKGKKVSKKGRLASNYHTLVGSVFHIHQIYCRGLIAVYRLLLHHVGQSRIFSFSQPMFPK